MMPSRQFTFYAGGALRLGNIKGVTGGEKPEPGMKKYSGS
jgi:hypothetical protein